MTDADLPVVSPPVPEETIETSDVWGVLLAAGTSSRFGDRNKLLQCVDGDPMVRRVAQTLLGAQLAGVIVVVGHERERVREALDGLDVAVRENEAYEVGQSTSVREGVDAVAERDADAVLVALGDMPSLSPGTVDALIATYDSGTRTALAAAADGKRGNPVLFDAGHFDSLQSVDGDIGGREILLGAGDAALVETGDPGVRQDIDRQSDWPP